MELGQVTGVVVSTVKEPKLIGAKLLIVTILNLEGAMTDSSVVAIDAVGAGQGEVVIVVRGSSSRIAANLSSVPVDAAIVGIVDAVQINGKQVFKK